LKAGEGSSVSVFSTQEHNTSETALHILSQFDSISV
jgi:hypothetical protein